MQVYIYAPDPAFGASQLVAEALQAAGHVVRVVNGSVFSGRHLGHSQIDAAFTFGSRLAYGDIVKAAVNDLVPVFVIDLSPIRKFDFFQVGEMGVNNFPDLGKPDRLGLFKMIQALKPGPSPEGPVLYLGQKPGDAQHRMKADQLRGYAEERAQLIHELLPDLQIFWKHHPMELRGTPTAPDGFVELPEELRSAPIPTVIHALKPRAVVTYNSTGAFDAILGRFPIFCDPSAFYAEAAVTDLSGIIEPETSVASLAKVKSLLARMSWGIWGESELGEGKFAQHIEERVEALKTEMSGPKAQRDAVAEAKVRRQMEEKARERRGRGKGVVRAIRVR